jgi:hypothetical protein
MVGLTDWISGVDTLHQLDPLSTIRGGLYMSRAKSVVDIKEEAVERNVRRKEEGMRKTYISVAAPTASSTPPNPTTAHRVGNNGANLSVASVTIPKVPSAPIKSLVISGPAADLRALERVLMISPEGRTTVCQLANPRMSEANAWMSNIIYRSIDDSMEDIICRIGRGERVMREDRRGVMPDLTAAHLRLTKFKNHSAFAVPYLTAFVPLHPVPHIPPIVAPGPGSSGKKSGTPRSFRWAFRSSHLTPG